MFITLLAAGTLALEREENAFARLVRARVAHGLLVEKAGLATVCSVAVSLLMLAGLACSSTSTGGASRSGSALAWARSPSRRSGSRSAR